VKDRENFDGLAAYAVRNDVGDAHDNEFADAGNAPWPASVGMVGQAINAIKDARDQSSRSAWTVPCNIVADCFKIA